MSPSEANVPMTTTFVVLLFGSILAGLVMPRDPESGFTPPILGALKILVVPVVVTVFAVELGFLQDLLMTTALTGGQWLACTGWSLIIPRGLRSRKGRSPTPPRRYGGAVAARRSDRPRGSA